MRKIEVGNVYKHFKNKYYIVIDIVNDCESNNDDEYKKIVIYKALYGEFLTWARPYEMFASEVDREKYPDVKQKYRFEEVKMENEKLQTLQNHINEYNKLIQSETIDLSKSLLKKKYWKKNCHNMRLIVNYVNSLNNLCWRIVIVTQKVVVRLLFML